MDADWKKEFAILYTKVRLYKILNKNFPSINAHKFVLLG